MTFSKPRIKFLGPVRFDSPYRLYIFAITIGSGSRYFMEVSLLDNLNCALHMKVRLHNMPYPIPQEEAI